MTRRSFSVNFARTPDNEPPDEGFEPMSWWVGVDIGGTKTAVVLSSSPPQVVGRIEFATRQERGPAQAIDAIKSGVREVLSQAGASGAEVSGIGVSCGSPLDPVSGIIQSPPNLATWVDVPIVEILAREFGCPVNLENDANAGAVAEHRFGGGR